MEEQEQEMPLNILEPQCNDYIVRNNYYMYDDITDESARRTTMSLTSMALSITTTALESGLLPCPINLHLNSRGGSLSGALAIVKAIEDIQSGEACKINNIKIPIEINTYIDGEADSGGSLISICGNKRYCSKYSMSLIHAMRSMNPQMQRTADQAVDLENNQKWEDIYRNIYIKKTKLTEEKINEIFKVEKFYTPEELLEFGCIDEII